jgi:hypothetical protein
LKLNQFRNQNKKDWHNRQGGNKKKKRIKKNLRKAKNLTTTCEHRKLAGWLAGLTDFALLLCFGGGGARHAYPVAPQKQRLS